ncbi:MAG: ATP-binding cassette domain-containing protein [Gemmatimonadaceae bacterium]
MLECRQLSVRAGTFMLRDVSFAIPSGGHAVLTGPTASGKTTLLELVAGAMAPTSGSVIANGVDVTNTPAESRGIGYVPQHGYLFPHLDVRRNIEYGANAVGTADNLASRFGIAHLLNRDITSLSGGERQLTALCRAVAPQPRILLLDEPLSALDSQRCSAALNELAALQTEQQFTVLHVTHHPADAGLATLRLEMSDGIVTVVARDDHGRSISPPPRT